MRDARRELVVRDDFLAFAPPAIGDEEIEEVIDTLRSGWITTGPKVKAFEKEFAHFVNADAALALNSGTGALHVALAALGVGPGDVVATTPMTFCATVSVIEHVGATPLLVDIDPATLNIDPDQLRDRLRRLDPAAGTPKAVIPVHYGGNPCDMAAIDAVAVEFDLAIVEDAAHALPARTGVHRIGETRPHGQPQITCFSFYATKNVTTGEGGMLTAAPDIVEECRPWALHGMQRDAWNRHANGGGWFYEVVRPGFKYNMSDLQAAIGLQQLRKVERFHERRQEIAARYDEAFGELPELHLPAVTPGAESAWHLYPLRLDTDRLDIGRDDFIRALADANIGTSVHFIPVHLHAWYRERYGYRPDDFPLANAEYLRSLSLPIHPGMTGRDVEDVIDAVERIVRSHRVP